MGRNDHCGDFWGIYGLVDHNSRAFEGSTGEDVASRRCSGYTSRWYDLTVVRAPGYPTNGTVIAREIVVQDFSFPPLNDLEGV